jgi:hypothetical protein
MGNTRGRTSKQTHNTIGAEHYYAQANTNTVNKTRALLQTPGRKDEPNIVLCIYLINHASAPMILCTSW